MQKLLVIMVLIIFSPFAKSESLSERMFNGASCIVTFNDFKGKHCEGTLARTVPYKFKYVKDDQVWLTDAASPLCKGDHVKEDSKYGKPKGVDFSPKDMKIAIHGAVFQFNDSGDVSYIENGSSKMGTIICN